MGCGKCEEEIRGVKEEVARGGWAEAARRTPATLCFSEFSEDFI